jgi:hypothetical protein
MIAALAAMNAEDFMIGTPAASTSLVVNYVTAQIDSSPSVEASRRMPGTHISILRCGAFARRREPFHSADDPEPGTPSFTASSQEVGFQMPNLL